MDARHVVEIVCDCGLSHDRARCLSLSLSLIDWLILSHCLTVSLVLSCTCSDEEFAVSSLTIIQPCGHFYCTEYDDNELRFDSEHFSIRSIGIGIETLTMIL